MSPNARAVLRGAPTLSAVLASACAMASGDSAVASDVQVPDGFAIEVFASDLPSVRTLKFGPDGMLYAALSDAGRIVRIDVASQDPSPETVVEGLDQPYGLAFFDGALYVGEEIGRAHV